MADLTRLRDDLGYFADAIGAPLRDWQLDAARLEKLVTVLLWARQMGKSRSLAVLALWWAFTRPGNRVFIISAGEGGAKRLLAEIRRMATGSPLLRSSVIDEQALLVTLTNGSEIRCAPASSSAIRGWQNDLLIVDESGSPTADVVLSAALPTITARPGARVVLADTAWAAEGPFYDFAMAGLAGGDDVRTFRRVARAVSPDDPDAVDAPWVTPTVVRMAREALGWRFGLEYECVFGGSSDLFFSRALIARCAAPIVVSSLAGFRGDARLLGGVDWAAKHDHSAVVGWGRLPVGVLNPDLDRPVFGVVLLEHWAPGEPLDHVVDELVSSRVPWDTLSIETNGIGEYPAQRLCGGLAGRRVVWVPPGRRDGHGDSRARHGGPGHIRTLLIATGADLKSQTFGRIRFLADRGQLVIPAETALMRELLSLRMELRPGGGVGIEAMPGRHDDLAMAAMLACGPYRQRAVESAYREHGAGQWRALLTDAADWEISDARVEPGDGDVVETGGGLRVWREPFVQSVFGYDVSRPAGWRRAGAVQIDGPGVARPLKERSL